ncbi:MAG: hypothetical protein AAB895_00480, partial [Patescibacteria group bacterium]
MPIDNEKAKSFLLSKTVWGVLAMAFAIFSDTLGVKIEGATDDIIGLIGAVFAIYGRVKASRPLAVF